MPVQTDTTECPQCETGHAPEGACPRAWCEDCDDWHERDIFGHIVCPGWHCDNCGDNHDYGDDCPGWYCEDCGDYHDYDDEACPAAGDGCGCTAPMQHFTVPNDGQAPFTSGARATVHLAAGVISEEGMRGISTYLRDVGFLLAGEQRCAFVNMSYDLHELGNKWQTTHGNYTKRLSRFAYQKHGLKVPPEVLSMVGTIARDHSTAADMIVDVTRDLNRPAADFYHDDSCWWGSYESSRCALKSNGGFGLRSFTPFGRVSGRAWVMPLRRQDNGALAPTFDTATPDALAVFNGYGALSGYAAARVVAAMYGWTYAKISFEAHPMYVNAGGYIVGPEDAVRATKSLYLDLDPHSRLYEKELDHAA